MSEVMVSDHSIITVRHGLSVLLADERSVIAFGNGEINPRASMHRYVAAEGGRCAVCGGRKGMAAHVAWRKRLRRVRFALLASVRRPFSGEAFATLTPQATVARMQEEFNRIVRPVRDSFKEEHHP